MTLKIKKFHPDAKLPTYAHVGDAGMDLYAVEPVTIYPNETKMIRTGVGVEIPEGYFLSIVPRSSIIKTSLIIHNAPGTVDSSYRGEIFVPMKNTYSFTNEEDRLDHQEFINVGQRIAQATLLKHELIELEEVDMLTVSERGESGFGSTGK